MACGSINYSTLKICQDILTNEMSSSYLIGSTILQFLIQNYRCITVHGRQSLTMTSPFIPTYHRLAKVLSTSWLHSVNKSIHFHAHYFNLLLNLKLSCLNNISWNHCFRKVILFVQQYVEQAARRCRNH